MENNYINKLIADFKLNQDRKANIDRFFETVPLYKLNPYINMFKLNHHLTKDFINANSNIKDTWDGIVELYRYNIKLSNSLYPYIFLLETLLKTQITKYFCQKFGNEWYLDEALIMTHLNFDDIDQKVFEEICYISNLKFVREKIIQLYTDNQSPLSANQIKRSKLYSLSIASSIIKESRIYKTKKTKNRNVYDFIETMPTFNYWLNLIEIKGLWINQSTNDLELEKVFQNICLIKKHQLEARSLILKDLNEIRNLRNYIAHHRRIIGLKTFGDKSLIDIYKLMLNMYSYIGDYDLNWMIGDLHCIETENCNGNSFEVLYNLYDFIHECDFNYENELFISK